jgi:hypothetical protein
MKISYIVFRAGYAESASIPFLAYQYQGDQCYFKDKREAIGSLANYMFMKYMIDNTPFNIKESEFLQFIRDLSITNADSYGEAELENYNEFKDYHEDKLWWPFVQLDHLFSVPKDEIILIQEIAEGEFLKELDKNIIPKEYRKKFYGI